MPAARAKWRDELNDYFADADVVIIADNDPQKRHPKTGEPMFHDDGRPILPGQDHAQAVAKALTGIAHRVRVLDLARHWPDMPLKGDVADWFAKGGGTPEALHALVERTPDWSPTQPAEPPAPMLLVMLDVRRWAGVEPRGESALLCPGSSQQNNVSLWLPVRAASEKPCSCSNSASPPCSAATGSA